MATLDKTRGNTGARSSHGSHLRVHFKHCREIAHHTSRMPVNKALKFLDDVLAFKAVVPFMRYTGGCGRKAQAKQFKVGGSKGRWPVKAVGVYRDLLTNAIANGESKGLDPELLYISHAQCNRAPPDAVVPTVPTDELASTPVEGVEKSADDEDMEGASGAKITKKMAAKKRFVTVGGGTN
eukprot:scaffold206000_cov34-Attheya_sp.AAC.2